MKKSLFIGLCMIFLLSLMGAALAVEQLISLQGKVIDTTGALVDSANVTVTFWDAATGGNLIHNTSGNFSYNITNGFFDILIGSVEDLNLNLSQTYFLDVQINDEDIDWDSNERRQFQSPVGYGVSGIENFTVDTQVLFVDTTNNRVGIGTTTPNTLLTVVGNVNISGSLNVTGNVTFPQLVSCDTINTDANGVLTCGSDATGAGDSVTGTGNSGNLSLWTGATTLGNSTLYQSGGLIGIGTLTPTELLVVAGNVNVTGNLVIGADGSGSIGIGTSVFSSTLEVAGNITTSQSNNTLGSFNTFQFNSSCAGFRFGTTGAMILSCT